LHRSCEKVSHTEGLNAMETALRYFEQQEDTTPDDLCVAEATTEYSNKEAGDCS
jgi:hypothetical protein